MKKTAFITGAGGGLGGSTADLFADRGWTVFAADVLPPEAGQNKIPVNLDVTDSASCERAAEQVASNADGLGVVINFAGVLEVGLPLVEVPEERMRRAIEVNLIGTYLVNKSLFPQVQAGGGRIVNISSAAGRTSAMPMSAPYSVSKHAVEAYSDALRRELMFVGIPVIIIQPGAFRTAMTRSISGRFAEGPGSDSPFAALAAKVASKASAEDASAHDPRELAEVVWSAVNAQRPKPRYAPNNSRGTALMDRLPAALLDRIVKRALG